MSVDSKLFVTCGKNRTTEVGQAVKKALDVWVRKELDEAVRHTGSHSRGYLIAKPIKDLYFTNGIKSIDTHDFRYYTFNFGCGDRNARMLGMFIDCSCDYDDTYEGDKIIFSIGCWGMYDEIMKVVAKAVASFGDVYYDFNDCDDQDFVKLEF
tara:strand:+ start:46 stop:504 length:459 start_codon:yes stop_codon:yes gene_type:complete